jgi:thiaminase/transcriptional activator TenA
MSGFSERAWTATADVRRAIDELPFLAELGAGTLAPASFRHYLEQDVLYLGGYARALALLSARAPDAEAASFWATSAIGCGVAETQLHADLLTDEELLAGPDRGSTVPEPSPTCLGYTSYLVATAATAPYAVGAAAVLPCFWVYAEVGLRLAREASAAATHPYRRWVSAYGAPEFQEATDRARTIADAAARIAPHEEPAMQAAFAVAARYELEFWRSAHVLEGWSHPL